MRREIAIAITFIVGVLTIIGVFFGTAKGVTTTLNRWYVVSVAFAVFVGAANEVSNHYRNVRRKRKNWGMSVVFLICLFGTVIVGVLDKPNGPIYSKIFQATVVPLGASVFALLAFYIGSAAYRAFRMRNLESTVLLLAACIVMLGRAPIGNRIWNGFPVITSWIMDIPNASAMRGILIGTYLGAFSQSAKVLLGIQRSHLGE